jgi:hypothetical protein
MVYDIFYVSKNIIDEQNWKQFRSKFPSSQKIDNVKSFDDIKKKAFTKFFWVVWDDVVVADDFNFEYRVSKWDEEYTHVWLNGTTFDGINLFPKTANTTQKEFDHRFFMNKKEMDVIASTPKKFEIHNIKTYNDYLNAKEQSSTAMFWAVWDDVVVAENFLFDYYVPTYDAFHRNITHVFKNGEFFDGIALFSKYKEISKKEFDHRFYVNKKEIDIVASKPKTYPIFIINNYEEYRSALENSPLTMFWGVWPNIEIINDQIFETYFSHHNSYDRNENHVFKNISNDQESFVNGVVLFSTNKPVSKKEIEHRFFIDKKEHDLVASKYKPYDKFVIDTFSDYEHALNTADTDMFWAIPPEVEPAPDFKFDLQFPYQNKYELSINHVFKNIDVEEIKYNGIMLLSKKRLISAREVEYRYLIEKKEYDLVASKLKLYDIVFISYNEPNADENFAKLIDQFPRAKRVHGVKGIHQAHIAAAKLATTPMFWVVDGDAIIEDDFQFDLLLPKHDTDIVHVWLSKNPINGLTYGYGGVKLLPKNLTINMDMSSVDMTMAISKKFKVIKEVSNLTVFNTDPFNTWKSAFRECVKLASRPVDSGYQEETEDRLITWCSIGSDKLYGEYSIAGARAGKQYGLLNIADADQLRKINDFEWLQKQFNTFQSLVKK